MSILENKSMSWNQTEIIFGLVNSKSKINEHIGKQLLYLNSHSIDWYLVQLERKKFTEELDGLEQEIKSDLEKETEIQEKLPLPKYDQKTAIYPVNQMDCFNQEQPLYADYKLIDLLINKKDMRSSDQEYKCSSYLINNLRQNIKINRCFDTINKVWFHLEKSSIITLKDIYALSKTKFSLCVGGLDIVSKNFSTCLIENLLNDYEIRPEENILRICLIDFETICDEQYGLPLISLQYSEVSFKFEFSDNSIFSYKEYIKYVLEGFYLENETRRKLAQNFWSCPIIKTQSEEEFVLSLKPYKLYTRGLEACVWISLCFNVDPELLHINKIGLMAENTEYLYFDPDDFIIISYESLTYYNIVLDPEYRDYNKFTSLLKNKLKDLDVRGVCLNEISDFKLQIDYNVDTQEQISFTVGYGGFDVLKIASGIACPISL